MDPAPRPVDARADRAVEGTVAVALLAAFVFGQWWLAPVVGLLVGAGAARGPAANPLHRAYDAVLAPRLPPASAREEPRVVQAQDALIAALLAVATLAFLVGLGAGGWAAMLAAAAVAAIAATTRVHLGAELHDRLRRH